MCAPMVTPCDTVSAHVCTEGDTLRRGGIACALRGCNLRRGGSLCDTVGDTRLLAHERRDVLRTLRHRHEDLSRAGERAAAVADQHVVDHEQIAALP